MIKDSQGPSSESLRDGSRSDYALGHGMSTEYMSHLENYRVFHFL